MRAWLAILAILCFPCAVYAQNLTDTVNQFTTTGVLPYAPYDGVSDSIAVTNGRLHLSVPVLSLPQRAGGTFNLKLVYDSPSWSLSTLPASSDPIITNWIRNEPINVSGGEPALRWNIPTLSVMPVVVSTYQVDTYTISNYCYTNWIFTDTEGTRHTFHNAEVCDVLDPPPVHISDTSDGSFIRLDTSNNADIVVYLKDGTQVHFYRFDNFAVGKTYHMNAYYSRFGKIVDPNGNVITTVDSDPYTLFSSSAFTVTDSVGRVITFNGPFSGPVTYKDSNGVTQTIAATSTTLTTGNQITMSHPDDGECYISGEYGVQVAAFPMSIGASTDSQFSLTIPNGGAGINYLFHFDAAGELTKISYPSGGYTSYDYGEFQTTWGDGSPDTLVCSHTSLREVVAKHECRSASGSCAVEDTTTYQPTVSGLGANSAMDIRRPDPSGTPNRTHYDLDIGYYSGRETSRSIYSGESTLLRTIQTDYVYATDSLPGPGNHDIPDSGLPSRRTTTLADVSPNQVSKVETDYDTVPLAGLSYNLPDGTLFPIDNPIEVREFGYDGALIRKTSTSWLRTGSYAVGQQHILNRPTEVSVYDGGSALKAQINLEYDNYTQGLSSSGATQHQVTPTTRGNRTAVSRWLNTTDTQLTTRYQYDDAGNITQVVDPKGNPTTYNFTDNFAEQTCTPVSGNAAAYPKTITNAANQVITYSYNSCLGNVATVRDANSQLTSYSYDTLGRMLTVTLPDGGQTSNSYGDVAPAQITTTQKLSSSSNLVTVQVYDGLGRLAESELTSDPLGTIYVNTAYDSLGRKASVTNAYRSISDATYGTTYFSYDALDRTTNVANPDGSNASTAYAGNQTTFSDEAGNAKKLQSDALGRLTGVWEDPNGLSYETDYQYDALGNLIMVQQGSLPHREFSYDSLSRLMTAKNPETGTICYGQWSGSNCTNGYDADGNLLARTDANGVVTSYTYDILNRMTNESASDGSDAQTLYYDAAPSLWGGTPFSCTNGIGRICQADHIGYSGTAFNYDPLGRVTSTLYGSITDGPPYKPGMSATYDLAGNPRMLTYPDGRQVTQNWDAAGRLASIVDSTSGTTYLSGPGPNNAVEYWPSGSVMAASYGNGVSESFTMNSRLQPCHVTANWSVTGGSTVSLIDRRTFHNPSTSSPCGSEAANNGNIFSIVDYLQTGLTQSFSYDSLNRITSGGRNDGAYSHAYNYDPFGNMVVKDNLASNAVEYSVDPTTNRLLRSHNGGTTWGDYVYDASGTLTQSSDGLGPAHTYQHNAFGQVISIDGGQTAQYAYNGLNERAYKITPSGWTNYIYFNGQPMAELSNSGVWTDYVYANGQKVAKVDNSSRQLHFSGTNSSGGLAAGYYLPFGNWYLIKPGDKIAWRQMQTGPASPRGGLTLELSDGSFTNWNTTDQNGEIMNNLNPQNAWVRRVVDLTPFVGKSVKQSWMVADANTGAGNWDERFADIALISGDGSVVPIYNGQASVGYPGFSSPGVSNQQFGVENVQDSNPLTTVHYYVDDHLGSTQMEVAGGGWPVWSGQFTPFGQEIVSGQVLSANLGIQQPGDGTNMHYKFTGEERDTESGLDYFGARYYASTMGRFMSPDPSGLTYANAANPQSLNLYGYAWNNPLINIDPTGLTCQTNSSDGNTYDDGDGKGCAVVDQQDADRLANKQYDANVTPPAQGTNLAYDVEVAEASRYLQMHQLPKSNDVPLNSYARGVFEGVAARTAWVPDVCSGGAFAYAGAQFPTSKGDNPGHGFVGGMVNADSKEGTTVSGLFDGGKKGVGGGVVAGQEKEGLIFIGEEAGVVLGVGSNGVSVGEFVGFDFGHYAGIGDGAYVNISTMGNCNHH